MESQLPSRALTDLSNRGLMTPNDIAPMKTRTATKREAGWSVPVADKRYRDLWWVYYDEDGNFENISHAQTGQLLYMEEYSGSDKNDFIRSAHDFVATQIAASQKLVSHANSEVLEYDNSIYVTGQVEGPNGLDCWRAKLNWDGEVLGLEWNPK